MTAKMSSKEKKDMSRDEIIRWRFKEMLGMAEEINSYKCDHKDGLVQLLAEEKKYLRICGEKFMPVSVAVATSLSGYGRGQCDSLEKALSRFEGEKANDVDPEILKGKEERRLQSWVISMSLQNGRSLKNTFSEPLKEFDDILFALDEVSLGDSDHRNDEGLGASRCDLLCLVKKNSQWHPLVIELKYKRMGRDLIKQVNRYAIELRDYRKELDPLLETITGKQVAGGDIQKMVIMPAVSKEQQNNPRVKKTYREYEEAGIHLVEYTTEPDFGLCPVAPLAG